MFNRSSSKEMGISFDPYNILDEDNNMVNDGTSHQTKLGRLDFVHHHTRMTDCLV